jgi:hypothetical protein
VRPSLFLETFAQGPDEYLCVDNVDAVGRWNIQVYGYQPPKAPNKQNYSNVCLSAYHWRSDEFAVGAENDLETPRRLEEIGELKRPPVATMLGGRNKGNAEFHDRFTLSLQAATAPLTCVVEIKYGDDRKRQLDAQSKLTTFFVAGVQPGNFVVSDLAPTAYYPASTLLRDLPGVRPASDRGASRTRPAVSFKDYPNSVMNGCFYKSIPGTERGACESACAKDPLCQAYSYSKINKTCELKHTLTALRRDPLSTSGVPSTQPVPGRSIRPSSMTLYGPSVGSNRITGKLIDEAKSESRLACSRSCESDPMCLALEFEELWDTSTVTLKNRVCRRFSEVTEVRDVPEKESTTHELKQTTTEIKRQN